MVKLFVSTQSFPLLWGDIFFRSLVHNLFGLCTFVAKQCNSTVGVGETRLVGTPRNSLEGSPILGTNGLDFAARLSFQTSFQFNCSVPVVQQFLWLVQQPVEMMGKPCCNPNRNKPWSSFGCVLLININITDARLKILPVFISHTRLQGHRRKRRQTVCAWAAQIHLVLPPVL